MAQDRIIEPARYAGAAALADTAAVEDLIPHRHELRLLDRVLAYDASDALAVGVYDVPANPFWARGHFPGRPIMPGVLVAEACAQLCCYYFQRVLQERGDREPRLLLLNRLDELIFRDQVRPGDRLLTATRNTELRSRRADFLTQAFVDDRLIFQGRITGMPVGAG